jgi:hypothetical protein
MLWWGSDGVRKGFSRNLSGQIECCGLRGGNGKEVSWLRRLLKRKVEKHGMCTHKETSVRVIVWVHEKRFGLDDDARL